MKYGPKARNYKGNNLDTFHLIKMQISLWENTIKKTPQTKNLSVSYVTDNAYIIDNLKACSNEGEVEQLLSENSVQCLQAVLKKRIHIWRIYRKHWKQWQERGKVKAVNKGNIIKAATTVVTIANPTGKLKETQKHRHQGYKHKG